MPPADLIASKTLRAVRPVAGEDHANGAAAFLLGQPAEEMVNGQQGIRRRRAGRA